jgi:hypothetical protein
MPRKLVGYILLSFLSFSFFTIVFNIIAIAQVSAQQSPSQITQPEIVPTPTIYTEPTYAVDKQVQTLSSPTPTVTAKQQTDAASQAQEIKVPLSIPTATPIPLTATPLPTATPTDVPQPTIATTSDLESLFSKYSSQYSVSEDELKKIANCESGFNSASDTGMYAGMFQFSASTWASIRGTMGLDGNPDLRKNADEAIKTAAFMIGRGQQNAWPNCH